MTRPARPFESNGLTLLTNRPLSAPATGFAGGLLLLLDLLLLTAMWPIVGVFVLATVVCGLVAGAALRRWNDAHPIPRGDRSSSVGTCRTSISVACPLVATLVDSCSCVPPSRRW